MHVGRMGRYGAVWGGHFAHNPERWPLLRLSLSLSSLGLTAAERDRHAAVTRPMPSPTRRQSKVISTNVCASRRRAIDFNLYLRFFFVCVAFFCVCWQTARYAQYEPAVSYV